MYDELEIKENLCIERAHLVARKQINGETLNDTLKTRTIVAKILDHKEKEEIMKRAFKLRDSDFYMREDYSKETILICKNLWEEVENLRKKGKYAFLKYDKIVTRNFYPRKKKDFQVKIFITSFASFEKTNK